MKLNLSNLRHAAALGVEVVDNCVRVAAVSKVGSGYLIENVATAPLPPNTVVEGIVVNQETLSALIKNLLKKSKIKKHPATLSLPASRIFVKHISLPVSTRNAIKQIIVDDFHMYFHFHNSGEAYFDFIITDKSKENDTKILVVVSKREVVDAYLSALKNAGLNIAAVSADYFALQNIFEINHGIDSSVSALISVGSLAAIVNIVKNGKSLLTHDISLQETEESFSTLSEELETVLSYYNSTQKDDFVEKIFVTGEKCSDGLLDLLTKNTGLPVQTISFLSARIALSEKAQHQEGMYWKLANELTISIGAAIDDKESYG